MSRNWLSSFPALCLTLIFLCESIGVAGQKMPRPSNLISFPKQEKTAPTPTPAAPKPQRPNQKTTSSLAPKITIECPDTVVLGDTFNVVYHLKANGWSNARIGSSKGFVWREDKVVRDAHMLRRTIKWECRAAGHFKIPAITVDVNGKTYTESRMIEVLPHPQYAREYIAGYEWLRTHMETSGGCDSLCLELYKRTDDLVLFNDLNRKAFVMVASSSHWSKGINPILAWSVENAYSYTEEKSHKKDAIWENYTAQLREMSTAGTEDYSLTLPYRRKKEKCAPILGDICWGQGKPYNLEAPLDAKGEHTLVGCVPVATSQVLKYFQSDIQLHTSVYYKEANGEIYSITFDDWHPDWKSMKGHYESEDRTASDASLTMLMVGMGLNARYGTEATSAHFNKIKPLLCYNFGFSPSMRTVTEKPDSIIYSLIYRDLDEGHPCVVSWKEHAFVVDGYDRGYLHYNLGWAGLCHGWYQSVLNTSASSTTQGLLRSVVVNINPRRDTVRKEVDVKKAGTLAALLPEEEMRTVTHMRITGKINGDDIRLLRKMAGCPQEEDLLDNQWGNLTYLDMSEATIVKSKKPYCSRPATYSWTHTERGEYGVSTKRYDLSRTMSKEEWKDFHETVGANREGVRYTYNELTGIVTAHLTTENDILGIDMFRNAEALETIILPSKITSIRSGSLVNCPLLRKLVIPKSVENIEEHAITHCQSLETVKFLNPRTLYHTRNFDQCSLGFKYIK